MLGGEADTAQRHSYASSQACLCWQNNVLWSAVSNKPQIISHSSVGAYAPININHFLFKWYRCKTPCGASTFQSTAGRGLLPQAKISMPQRSKLTCMLSYRMHATAKVPTRYTEMCVWLK